MPEVDYSLQDATLDRLLRGGFRLPHDKNSGLVVLLRGKAGTGKSTLALQIATTLKPSQPPQSDQRPVFCTLEQTTDDVRYKLASMLVARALDKGRQPVWSEDYFKCLDNEFWEDLEQQGIKLEPAKKKSLSNKFSSLNLPLYGEPSDQQKKNCESVTKDLAEFVQNHLEGIIQIRDNWQKGSSEGSFGGASSRILQAVALLEALMPEEPPNAFKRPIVVLDGLSLLSAQEREAIRLPQIVDRIRRMAQIGILVYEPAEEGVSLDHHADMVIELTSRTIERPLAYLIHELCIKKSRYQDAALGQHQFKIRSSGVAVFPSLHFQVHHYNYMGLELKRSSGENPIVKPNKKPAPCEDGSLIDMIFNPIPGESVVLLGSRNSFKTQICLDFLARGCWGCPYRPGAELEQGLLISLIDNAPDIKSGLICPPRSGARCSGDSLCDGCKSGLITHARPFCQRPGCITPAEFFHYVQERILYKANGPERIKRTVFWDLTQMDYRFPLFKEDKMILPALMDMFKTNELKSLFMGAGNADNTKAASAMADHVLFCWRSRYIPATEKDRTVHASSLMLYVDRTSAASSSSGKALYCLAVNDKDELQIPLNASALKERMIAPDSSVIEASDKELIGKIKNLQGVA